MAIPCERIDMAPWDRDRPSMRHQFRRQRYDPREVFEVHTERLLDRDSFRIRWRSRVFDLDRVLELRANWVQSVANPNLVVEFIQELVGTDLMNWAELGAPGREMGIALCPLWDQAIFRFVEQLEREVRYGGGRNVTSRIADFNREYVANFALEDPAATKKARTTLLRHLDEAQRASFEKDQSFAVVGKDTKTYTIKRARSFNVVAPDGTKYCGQLEDCPIEDQMLAQKLLLQNDPEKFFKNANVSRPQGLVTNGVDRAEFMHQYVTANPFE